MSGDVSIGVMLTVERAFETGHPENTLLIQLCLDSPKETSIGEYIRPRARAAPAALQLLQKLPLRVVNSSAVKLGAASHTHPQTASDSLVPRHRARASKELRARRDRGAQRLLTAIQKKTCSFFLQPVTKCAPRAEPHTNRPKREASPDSREPRARRHPFGQVEEY